MEETSKNGFDLITISGKKLKGQWGRAFLGTMIYLFPLLAFLLIPYVGIFISIALFGWLTAGYIEFMKQIINGERANYNTIFCTYKEFAQSTIIGIVLACGIVLGSVLFIVPGILMILYYSMSLFVLNEDSVGSVYDTFNITSRKMYGNKLSMISYKIVYYLFYALIAICGLIAFMFIANLYKTQMGVAVVLGIVDFIACFVLLSIVTVYFYASNVIFYNESVKNKVVEDFTVTKPVKDANVKDINVIEKTNDSVEEEKNIKSENVETEEQKENNKKQEVKKVEKEVKKQPNKKSNKKEDN